MISLDAIVLALAQPTLLVGFLAFLGLLFLRRPVAGVLSGVVGAMVGYVMLVPGALVVQESLLRLADAMSRAFGIAVLVPHNEAMAALVQPSVGLATILILVFGLLTHLVIARVTRFRFLFLTAHQSFFMAALLALVLTASGLAMPLIVFVGALLLGVWSSLSPALGQAFTRRVTGDEAVALGHFGSLGYYLAGWVGARVNRRYVRETDASGDGGTEEAPSGGFSSSASGRAVAASALSDSQARSRAASRLRSTEDIRIPSLSSLLRNVTVTTSLSMTLVFVVAALAAEQPLSAAVVYALFFAVGIAVILAGLRLLLADVPPLLTALGGRFVPDALPAVDCAALFPYAPSAVVIGFLCSLSGALVGMVGIGLLTGLWILPSVVPHFFCGATAGIYGNATGGLRGAIAGALANGLLLTALPALLSLFTGSGVAMTSAGTMSGAFGATTAMAVAATFGDTDYAILGTILGALGTTFGPISIAMLAIGVACGVWMWGRKR
ncbi:MAG: hypothetical protein PUJ57_05965 [Peptoniphilaceae bacterium]|nr:hypothetical protein [Peptoniphilaceae bacterium]MDY6085768.1 PTS transporter subunit IIC [Peptoniphilaceae bacterium]